jgi:hypothetical protein
VTIDQLRALLEASDLNLLSNWSPCFLVSLYVPTTYGCRVQTGKLEFASKRAFEAATPEEVMTAIDEMHARLLRAAKTQQGDVAKGGTVKVATEAHIAEQVTINYPAH